MAEKPTSDHSSQKFKPSSHPPPPTQLPNPTPDADHPKKVGPLKSSATQALTIAIPTAPSTVFSGQPTFSQLLAGAMSGSPLANSSLCFQVPMVAVPYFVSPVGLIESPSMTGHFGMTHQAVLASVTAHAQMQLQMGRASCSPRPTLHAMSSPSSTISQQKKLESDENISTPKSGEQKSPSSQIVVKATSNDGYNWRKYGQKQVKVSENSRSYYRCTHSNCLAKKKVEHCQDGHVAEIVYRGQHSHFPPEKIRSSRERGSPISSAVKDDHSMDFQSAELANSDNLLAKNDEQTCPAEGDPDPCPTKDDQRPCPTKGDPDPCLTKNDQHQCPAKLDLDPCPANNDQHPEHETPKELPRSSDCKVDPNTNSNEAHAGPDHKRIKLCDVPVAYEPSLFKSVREGKVVVRHSYDEGPSNDGYRWRKYGQKIVKGNPNPRSYYKCNHMGCQVRKHVERAEDARVIITTYEGHHNHDIPPPRSSIDSPASRPDHELKHQSHPLDKALVCFSDSRTLEYEEKQKESDQFELDMEPEPNTEDVSGSTTLKVIQRPFLDGNHAAVPVKSSTKIQL